MGLATENRLSALEAEPGPFVTKIGFVKRNHLRIGILTCLFVFVFYSTIQGLVKEWWQFSSYSHGFIIPFVSGFFIWKRRSHLRKCIKKSSFIGLGLFILGLAMFYVGVTAEEETIEQISLPVTLMGLVYFLGGLKVAKLSLFPVGYLFLMIPPPYPIYKALALKLRLLDGQLTQALASLFGVPIFLDGYLIHLPNITLEVADACSGVFSILSLLAIGILYIHQSPSHRKALLYLMLIPIAILSNVVRIATIVVLTYHLGDWILNSTFHRLSGIFNFFLGFLALIIMSSLTKGRFLARENEA